MEKNIKKVKAKIKKLAEEFDLKCNSKMFKVSVISKKDYVKLIYVLGCPLDPYMKFGKTRGRRIENYNTFVCSKEFSEEAKRSSGTVVEKKYFDRLLKKIKDKKVKKEFERILEKIGLEDSTPVAVLTKPENEKEARLVFGEILFHEWIHTLLRYNNVNMRKSELSVRENFDEGLVSYLQIFLTSENKDFEQQIKAKLKKIKDSLKTKGETLDEYTEDVFDKLLFWNNILKEKKTPKERRRVIENIMKKSI